MTDNASRYLFVYGTLMSGARGALGLEQRLRLARDPTASGPPRCTLRASTISAAIPVPAISDGEEDIVHGEVVLLADPDAALAWLDDYEGYVHGAGDSNEYDRLVREVRLAGGETFDAWVYLLRRAPAHSARIANGRWIGR